jgi:hypothetical protein
MTLTTIGTAGVLAPEPITTAAGAILLIAAGVLLIADSATNTKQIEKSEIVTIHHIATDKNSKSNIRGGPWTPVFANLFAEGGLDLNIPENKVPVAGHAGPHPEEYHDLVYTGLNAAVTKATFGKTKGSDEYTKAAAVAIKKTLIDLGIQCSTPGTWLNQLITVGIPMSD